MVWFSWMWRPHPKGHRDTPLSSCDLGSHGFDLDKWKSATTMVKTICQYQVSVCHWKCSTTLCHSLPSKFFESWLPGLANLAESTPLLSTMHWWSLAHIYCFSHLSFHNDNNTPSDWPVGLLCPIQSDSIRVSAGTHLRDLARASWRDVCPSTQVDETRASWIYLIDLHCVKCPVSPVAATGESISPAKRAACIVQRIRD